MRGRQVVIALFIVVLLVSGANVALALTKPDPATDGAQRPSRSKGIYRPADLAGPGGPALSAASTSVAKALTYDHRDLGRSLKAATATMTPAFAGRFRKTFRQTLAPVAKRRKAATRGLVRGAGLIAARDDERATCLLFVDQEVTSARRGASSKAAAVNRYRLLVHMVRRDGRWLLNGVDQV